MAELNELESFAVVALSLDGGRVVTFRHACDAGAGDPSSTSVGGSSRVAK